MNPSSERDMLSSHLVARALLKQSPWGAFRLSLCRYLASYLVVSLPRMVSCLARRNEFERSIAFLSRVEGRKPSKRQPASFSFS